MTEITRESLMTDWLTPTSAAKAANVSYSWLKQLGERGQVETLQTPLGMLYKRTDMERIAEERASRAGIRPGRS
jgi:hypothetical protein